MFYELTYVLVTPVLGIRYKFPLYRFQPQWCYSAAVGWDSGYGLWQTHNSKPILI